MNLKNRHLFRHLTDINAKDPLWERVFADWTGRALFIYKQPLTALNQCQYDLCRNKNISYRLLVSLSIG